MAAATESWIELILTQMETMIDPAKKRIQEAAEVATVTLAAIVVLIVVLLFMAVWWLIGFGYACLACAAALSFSLWRYDGITRRDVKQIRDDK